MPGGNEKGSQEEKKKAGIPTDRFYFLRRAKTNFSSYNLWLIVFVTPLGRAGQAEKGKKSL